MKKIIIISITSIICCSILAFAYIYVNKMNIENTKINRYKYIEKSEFKKYLLDEITGNLYKEENGTWEKYISK